MSLILITLRIFAVFSLLSLTSFVTYYYLYRFILPKHGIFKQPVYFDFNETNPMANISLSALEKQWSYQHPSIVEYRKLNKETRFLMEGLSYQIEIDFLLPKSKRNFELSKFMLYLYSYSKSGELIAKSSRPVIIPYQSDISKYVEDLLELPFVLFGKTFSQFGAFFFSLSSGFHVRLVVMNSYVEPRVATDRLDVVLSSSLPDIGDVFLTVIPELNIIT
jgi:hypothetical protein